MSKIPTYGQGLYKIYIHSTKVEENITQVFKATSKPSTDTSNDGPGVIIPKINRVNLSVSVDGSILRQNATIAGTEMTISSKDAKNFLKDMFLATEKTYLYWDGFNEGYKQVVPNKIQFTEYSNIKTTNSTPQKYAFTSVFTLGENILAKN